jgi:hypothetical protein
MPSAPSGSRITRCGRVSQTPKHLRDSFRDTPEVEKTLSRHAKSDVPVKLNLTRNGSQERRKKAQGSGPGSANATATARDSRTDGPTRFPKSSFVPATSIKCPSRLSPRFSADAGVAVHADGTAIVAGGFIPEAAKLAALEVAHPHSLALAPHTQAHTPARAQYTLAHTRTHTHTRSACARPTPCCCLHANVGMSAIGGADACAQQDSASDVWNHTRTRTRARAHTHTHTHTSRGTEAQRLSRVVACRGSRQAEMRTREKGRRM